MKPTAVFSTPALPTVMAPYSIIRLDAIMDSENMCLTISDIVDSIGFAESFDPDVSIIHPSLWIVRYVELREGS